MITARTTGSVGRWVPRRWRSHCSQAVRERGEDDVALPPGQGAPFEVIEAEFVLQLLILLLDRPALMRQPHQRAQRRGRGQVDEIVLGAVARPERAFAEQPDLGRETTVAPVVRGRDARGTEPGPPRGLRAVAPRHHAPRACGLGRGPGACLEGRHVGRERRPRSRTTEARARRRRDEGRGAEEDGERGRDAQGVRQLRAVQGPPQRRTLAELRIAEHRGHGDPARPDLPQQRQRELPLRLPADTRPECGRACAASGVSHDSGRYNVAPSIHARAPVHNATVTAVWQLAILPSAPQYCRATPTECGPCFGKARAVENEDARAIGNRGAQVAPHGVGRPRRIGDEMLERLIGARIADALQHRAHRLAAAVAQQPEQIAAKRAALRHVREADLERLEPFAQAIEPRRRIARQSRQHRAAAYRSRAKSTRPLISIPVRLRSESADLVE